MAKERERRERAAAAADEEFSAEFLTAARKVRSSVQSSPVPARAFVLLFGVLFVSLAWHATLVFGTLVGKLSGIGISGLRLELCSNGIQHGITLVGYRCYPSNSPSLRISHWGFVSRRWPDDRRMRNNSVWGSFAHRPWTRLRGRRGGDVFKLSESVFGFDID